ncbi:rab11 family-interacting protein 1-like isoform X1 [Solea senegalensis]|uniref:Rab11 family-interacting protein 1-like isoform X1 n=2 Tax=Solea senegalensis TaxID=28829 RepID=A0AAV6RW47_SOLSE|nr:rab11 family-interacting protein 1 isoform X1 [Solea senegalensis]KAG7509793.1 rab11 family-interacting protein 1-like isoform X1 [Solea senegalensis]
MSSLTVEEEQQRWAPTHVQVTVLRGRGLRGKGKHGTSDVYTIIQLGKEKYSTCVAEKTTEPEWREECSFELQPGALERGGGGGCPAGSNELVLTVMHRALIGMDVFLGQAVVQLDKVFNESRCLKNEWYRLNSKTGKKEKERGDIQVTVQFTRNNLTASMYDLVMKDKGFSTFTKLKERMRGKRRSSEEDSSSVVMPGGQGSLCQMRNRLPSDGGGEEDYEDDEGGEARRSKMRTFFLRGKLRKSSDTRSSTSLGSESSESSSRGGSLSPTAGISVVVSDLSNSPSNSSNLTADNSPEHTANTSPKSSSFKCDFGDEAGEITIAVPQPTVCVNGSHAYQLQPLDPGSQKPADSLGLGLLQKSLPLSMSLQNLSPHASLDPHKSPTGDGRRWSFDKPGEEEKAAIAAALEQSGPMRGEEEEEEERLGQAAPSKAASAADSESQGKKQRRNFFSHGRSESAGRGQSQSEDAPVATGEKHKGWFGSKESHIKPSLVVSPILEFSTDPFPPLLPTSDYPLGPPVDPNALVSPFDHTNPFSQPQTTPPPMSPCNPFFSVLQHNPFYEDMLITPPLKPLLPPLPYLSSSRPPIAQLFPQSPNHTLNPDNPTAEDSASDAKNDPMAKVEEEALTPAPMEGEKPLCQDSSNPFMSARELEPDSEWDECFEAFAAGRLQSPEDLTTDCEMQQSTPGDRPLENYTNNGTLLPITDADPNTDANDAQPCSNFLSVARETTSQVTNANAFHLDTFANLLETIPEQFSFESEKVTLNTDSAKPDACTDTNHTSSTSTDLNNTNMHHAPSHTPSIQLNSSSPDPGSSGLGSSAEEDFLSCLSSNSDKFSSSEEAEARHSESNILGLEKAPAFTVVKNSKPFSSEDDVSDKPNDRILFDAVQKTVDERVDSTHTQPQSPVIFNPQVTNTRTGVADTETLNVSKVAYPDLLPKLSELQPEINISSRPDDESKGNGLNSPIIDFSTELVDSPVNKDVKILATPDDEFPTTLPAFNILTSSPDVMQSSWDFGSTSSGGQQEARHFSPVPFGAFGDVENFDTTTLLHTRVSDQSSTSFLQSLYVSTDSQNYQTCESSKSSSVSEPHSANSTLCGELSDIQTTTLGLQDSFSASKSPNPKQTDRFEEFSCGVDDKAETPKAHFFIPNTSALQPLPAPLTDSEKTRCPSEGGVESQHVVMDDRFSKSPESQSATLHRSQSEGTLTHAFHDLLLPSFGSDPGAIQESSMAPPGPALSCLTSFAPSSLTPSSSPFVALYSFPYPTNVLARSSAGTARAAVPKTEEMQQQQQQQQEQEASQQNSPHPVKPLTTAMLAAEEKRTEGRSVLATGLEKLKFTISPGRSSQSSTSEQETPDRKKFLTEGAGSYYHLTHSELVALLVQREAELERQKAEFERHRVLLAKREGELKRLKPQVRDLEDYIDTLLVRIMEQKPTLLQVGSRVK